MKINYKRLLIFILIPVLLGTFVGLITSANSSLNSIIPKWIFPVVWTILYILMGISSYLVYEKDNEIPKIYIWQLIVNLLWSFIFFTFRLYLIAFIWIIFLFILVIQMIKTFREYSTLASNLQIPYAIWLIIAAILNFMYLI
jgi:tryptophan-rich sensory protein